VLGAVDVGAPHKRDRIWIVGQLADSDRSRRVQQRRPVADAQEHKAVERGNWWATEPGMGRMAHGLANRVDRLRAIGNGQVPGVAALVFDLLTRRLHDTQA
jgi:DNA (cytosine-5)-methyltransferase 1